MHCFFLANRCHLSFDAQADDVEVVRSLPTPGESSRRGDNGKTINRASNFDIRGRSVGRKIEALIAAPARSETEQHWRISFSTRAAELANQQSGTEQRGSSNLQLDRSGFVELSFELLANTPQNKANSSPDSDAQTAVGVEESGENASNPFDNDFIQPNKSDLERAFDLSRTGSSVVTEEEFLALMSLAMQGAVAGLSEKGFLGFGWGKEVKFKELLAACTQSQADALFSPLTSESLVNLFEESNSSEGGSVESNKQAVSSDSVDGATALNQDSRSSQKQWQSLEAQGAVASGSSKQPGRRLLVRFESQEESRTAPAQEQRFSSMPRNLPSREESAAATSTDAPGSSSVDRYRARSSVDRGTANVRDLSARPMIGVRPTPPALRPNTASSLAPRAPAPDRRPFALSTARYTEGQSSNSSSSNKRASSSSSSVKSGSDKSKAPAVAKPSQPKVKRSSLSMRPWRSKPPASAGTTTGAK